MKNIKYRLMGFYWVFYKKDWIVALFVRHRFFYLLNHWVIPGHEEYYTDADFDEIDENVLDYDKKVGRN